MKKIAIVISSLALLLTACSHNQNNLTGAGSSFIYPVLSIWAKDYDRATNIQVNYQAIGSGGGLQQIYSGTIDFAASDMPLDVAQLAAHKLEQFPMIIGGIVLTVNLPGIQDNQLVLNGDLLEKIYTGKIQYWDSTDIQALNKDLNLPHQHIIPIHRADGSGTTFNFTNYLGKISPEWQKQIGSNTIVAWPNGIGANGNAGVASQVQQTPYSIGYVEYAYAKQNNMAITRLVNHDGKIVTASAETFAEAAKNASWSASNGFHMILTNQKGTNSWPIVATTFILVPQNSLKKQSVTNFFNWCFANGAAAAQRLDYVAVPQQVYQAIIKVI